MALKEIWKDKHDGISDILAEDINNIARAVIQLENESGGVGESGATFYPSVSAEGVISWTNDRELPNPTPVNIKGAKGDKGEQGERGIQGEKGVDGKDGVNGKDGTNGKDGEDGQDGFSPIVAVADTEGGHRVTITDKDGEKTFIVMDGKDGQGGVDVSVQSDWEQNDPEAPDYVKNRPFYSYTETSVNEFLLANGRYTSVPFEDFGGAFAAIIETDSAVQNNADQSYTVIFDGVSSHELKIYNTEIGYLLGNGAILAPLLEAVGLPSLEDTGEPFVFLGFGDEYISSLTLITDLARSTTHDVLIRHTVETLNNVTVKIPQKYVDTIGQFYGENGGEIFNDYERNNASGEYAHAEGSNTNASGAYSHAEGASTGANHECAHAEGQGAFALSSCTHAEGRGTIAYGACQHTQGRYNIQDSEQKYAHIVGNGNGSDDRSNAHTLDWTGLGWFAGGLKVGGTGQDDENAVDVLTFADMTTIIDAVLNAYPNGDEVSY